MDVCVCVCACVRADVFSFSCSWGSSVAVAAKRPWVPRERGVLYSVPGQGAERRSVFRRLDAIS